MNRNSLVMFRKRCQQAPYPMRVQTVMAGRRECLIDNRWWPVTSLMPYEEWKKRQSPSG